MIFKKSMILESVKGRIYGRVKRIMHYTQTHWAYPNSAVFRVLLGFELRFGQPPKPNGMLESCIRGCCIKFVTGLDKIIG